jgi:hypothetical protein
MHILDFSTVSYQFYIIPIQIIEEDAILNYYFEAKCACLAAMLDSISGHACLSWPARLQIFPNFLTKTLLYLS